MSLLNITGQARHTYDAIVIGSGISGGWAAKELCEKGLETLVLERGRMVRHVDDYPTMHADPWDLPGAGANRGQRIGHRLLGVVMGVDADMAAGNVLRHR